MLRLILGSRGSSSRKFAWNKASHRGTLTLAARFPAGGEEWGELMSEYLEEARWRERYRDLAAGVGTIRDAVEQSFGPIAASPNPERLGTSIEDCRHIAEAIFTYAAKMQCRITQLEKALKRRELAGA
jgi:hypothetical protein